MADRRRGRTEFVGSVGQCRDSFTDLEQGIFVAKRFQAVVADHRDVGEDGLAQPELLRGEFQFLVAGQRKIVGDIPAIAEVQHMDGLISTFKHAAYLKFLSRIEQIRHAPAIGPVVRPGAPQVVALVILALRAGGFLAVEHVRDKAAQGGLALLVGAQHDLQAPGKFDFPAHKPPVSV